MPEITANKPFTWSYTALETFESCPRKYYDKYILGNKEDDSPALVKGRNIHKKIEDCLKINQEVPYSIILPFKHAIEGHEYYVEKKMGLTKELKPCEFFGKEVWGRAASDLLIINETKALDVDWKTGKIKDKRDQLASRALFVFSEFPKIKEINALNVYVEHDKHGDIFTFYREEFFSTELVDIFNRVDKMRIAYENHTQTPNPSYICNWCPVKSCQFNKSKI